MGKRAGVELEDRVAALAARIDAALTRARTPIPHPNPDPETRVGLEDRIVELEAALVGEREARARAEALAEDAQREANAAFDQLESVRSESSTPIDPSLGEAFQEKLLEIERLTRERDALRTSSVAWRSKAQKFRRERDEATLALSRTDSELKELRERDESSRRKLDELERRIAQQKRELEVATRRAEHLRQHFSSTAR